MIRIVPALLIALFLPPAAADPALKEVVRERVEHYGAQFPTIGFLLLDGADVSADMAALSRSLGTGARDRVYEHPDSLAATLMELSLQRVRSMLEHGAASASLYEVGGNAAADRPYLCVLTLSTAAIARDSVEATGHMIDVEERTIADMPAERRLGPVDHLRFVVDHEVFHCLDARFVTPIPMSELEHWGDYRFFYNEHGADAFAIAAHLARNRGVTDYARSLMALRALSLVNRDPNHCTCESIREVIETDAARLAAMSSRAMVDFAHAVRTRHAGSYEDYLRFRRAAHAACNELGIEPGDERYAPRSEPLSAAERALVNTLVMRTRSCYRQMFGGAGAACGEIAASVPD